MSHDAKLDIDYLWDAILDANYGAWNVHHLVTREVYREAAEELRRLAMAAR